MLDILKIKNHVLKNSLDLKEDGYLFLANVLTKILTPITDWQYSPVFEREIIMLPVIEVKPSDEFI